LKDQGCTDAECLEIVQYWLDAQQAGAAAQDQTPPGPPDFEGMPQVGQGPNMAGDEAMTRFKPEDIDVSSHGYNAFDRQYDHERRKAAQRAKARAVANAKMGMDAADGYGHFLNALATNRPRGLDLEQTKRLANAMSWQRARSIRDGGQPLAQDAPPKDHYDPEAMRRSEQSQIDLESFEAMYGTHWAKMQVMH
jgi:hypothetical protein